MRGRLLVAIYFVAPVTPICTTEQEFMTCLRMCAGLKEDAEDTALRSKRPRSKGEHGEDEGWPDERARVIEATCYTRCNRPRVHKEGASIRPFLESRKTRGKQDDGSKELPQPRIVSKYTG